MDIPGRVVVRRTAEGLVLTADHDSGTVRTSGDGLPVLEFDQPVSNAEVLASIDQERATR